MSDIDQLLKDTIRDVPNFPKEGIIFKDITTILSNPKVSTKVCVALREKYAEESIDVVVGIDSRGFLYGNIIALDKEIPFVPVRKKGKLPYQTIEEEYALEYGTATVEIHSDAIQKGQKVLIHDDLLATGGTAKAAAELVTRLGGEVVGFSFLVELSFLEGKSLLNNYSQNIFSLATY